VVNQAARKVDRGLNGTHSQGRQTLVMNHRWFWPTGSGYVLLNRRLYATLNRPVHLSMLNDDDTNTILASFSPPDLSSGLGPRRGDQQNIQFLGGLCVPNHGLRMRRLRNPTSTIVCPSDTLLTKCLQHSTQNSLNAMCRLSWSLPLLVVLLATLGLERKCCATQLSGDMVSKV